MDAKVVIHTPLLRFSGHDSLMQRVASVYLKGHEYKVWAPSRAAGPLLDWTEQLTVRIASESGMGENLVDGKTSDAIVSLLVDKLKQEEEEADFWDWGNRPNARFYYAQICLRGHVITAGGLDKIREDEHCELCGSRCIHRCEKCNAPIRGKRTMHGGEDYRVPAFCYRCATPYPWMRDRLETAHELLWHDDHLSEEDRENLWGLLQYVMSDPKSDLVPAKRKLIDIKLEPALAATREFILDFLAKYSAEMSKP